MDSLFKSEAQRLRWLIREIELGAAGTDVSLPDPESLELFRVTGCWMEICLTQAKGVLSLVERKLFAAVGPLHRCLWELWINWRYLLTIGDRRVNSAKVILNAEVETVEFAEAHPKELDPAYLAFLRKRIQEFELRNPEAAAQIRDQRRKRRFQWSGKSYSEMERLLSRGRGIYRPLSWETHAIVAAIRDVRVEVKSDGARIEFGKQEEIARPDFTLFSCGGVLFYIYNDFAKLWGLSKIALPKMRAGSHGQSSCG